MKYNKILILVTTIFLIIAMNTICFADNADKTEITTDLEISSYSSINGVINYGVYVKKNDENHSLFIKASDYSLPSNLYDYKDSIRLRVTYSQTDYSVLNCKVVNHKTSEIVEDLSEENMSKLFNIEYEKNITEKNWVDTIKLSELTQNEIYKYTANSTIQFPKIENDIGKNCLLYIKGRLDNNYKSEIYMSKKISGSSLSISFDEYSSGESFKIMYKELSNEELLKLVNKEEIIYLSNYKDGDKLEYQFEKYIYNDTEKNITIDTQDTAFGAEKTNTTTIEKGAIYGFNWMIDSATISYSKNISPNNNNANTNIGNISNSNTLQESVNKVTSSTSKLPQTGNFLSSQSLLILLIIICTIGIISNFKYKNINTK